MTTGRGHNKAARLFLKQAHADLAAGKILYSNDMSAHAMFCGQDAVEKAVKGTFLHFGIVMKKEHLFKKIYNQTRYPDAHDNQNAPVDVIDAESAKAMLDIAEAALEAGEKLLELDSCDVRDAWKAWEADPIAVKQTVEKSLEALESYRAGFTGSSGH